MNDKMGGDIKKIQLIGRHMIEVRRVGLSRCPVRLLTCYAPDLEGLRHGYDQRQVLVVVRGD